MVDLKNQRLLVIAPHPDDEILGCGGLIKRIKEAGGKVYVLFMTVGTTQDYTSKGISTHDERLTEIENVAKFLNYDDYSIAFPGNGHHLRLDNIPQLELISAIERGQKVSIEKVKPSIIATPQTTDYNQDHRASALATMTASRPAPEEAKQLISMVITYEFMATALWSIDKPSTPNIFLELTHEHLNTKLKAMELYQSQTREGFNPRAPESIRSLAFTRGSQTGVQAAEAFFGYRTIIAKP